jgi:outer membrane protein
MTKLGILSILAAAILAAAAGLAAAQQQPSQKIGYVNTDRVMAEARVAQAAKKSLEDEFKRRDEEIAAGPPANIERRRAALFEDMSARREETLKGLIEKANATIRRIAMDENLDAVFYEASYAAPRVDITEKVIKALDAAR